MKKDPHDTSLCNLVYLMINLCLVLPRSHFLVYARLVCRCCALVGALFENPHLTRCCSDAFLGVVGSITIILSQILQEVCQWNNYENPLIFAKGIVRSQKYPFCWTRCSCTLLLYTTINTVRPT